MRESARPGRLPSSPPAPTSQGRSAEQPSPGANQSSIGSQRKARFTHRQGQFLAFIHLYRKLHRQSPCETEMVQFFGVTPSSVHSMIVRLHELKLITRRPGVARTIQLAIPEADIPPLEAVDGRAW